MNPPRLCYGRLENLASLFQSIGRFTQAGYVARLCGGDLNQVITKGQADMLDVSKAVEDKIKDAVANAVMGIEGKTIDAAKNGAVVAIEETRQESLRVAQELSDAAGEARKQAWRYFGVWLLSMGAIGAVVGSIVTMAVQGRTDAKEFGKYPGVYCSSANGEKGTTEDGRQYCAFWLD